MVVQQVLLTTSKSPFQPGQTCNTKSLGCVLIYLNSGIRNHKLQGIPDLKFYFTVAGRFHSILDAPAEDLGSVPSTHIVPPYHL